MINTLQTYLYEEPTDAFRHAYERAKNKVSRAVRNYRDRVFPEPVAAPPDPFARWPRPWSRSGKTIVDDHGYEILQLSDAEIDELCSTDLLDAVIKAVNDAAPRAKIDSFF